MYDDDIKRVGLSLGGSIHPYLIFEICRWMLMHFLPKSTRQSHQVGKELQLHGDQRSQKLFQPERVTGVGYGAWEDMKAFASAIRSALWSQVQWTGTARDG